MVDTKSSTIVIRYVNAMKLILALTRIIRNFIQVFRNTKCSLTCINLNLTDSDISSLLCFSWYSFKLYLFITFNNLCAVFLRPSSEHSCRIRNLRNLSIWCMSLITMSTSLPANYSERQSQLWNATSPSSSVLKELKCFLSIQKREITPPWVKPWMSATLVEAEDFLLIKSGSFSSFWWAFNLCSLILCCCMNSGSTSRMYLTFSLGFRLKKLIIL